MSQSFTRSLNINEIPDMNWKKKVPIVFLFLIICYYFFRRYVRNSKGFYRFLARINWDMDGISHRNDEYYPYSKSETSNKKRDKYFIMFTGQECKISRDKKDTLYGNSLIGEKIRDLFKDKGVYLVDPIEADTYEDNEEDKGTGKWKARKFQERYNTEIKGYPSMYLIDGKSKEVYEYDAKLDLEHMKSFLEMVG